MREFFRGWKRKIGVVTLVMACVFIGGWVRSIVLVDKIHIMQLRIRSVGGAIQAGGWVPQPGYDVFHYVVFLSVSYRSVVIPLTALSAYLLLSKPSEPRGNGSPG